MKTELPMQVQRELFFWRFFGIGGTVLGFGILIGWTIWGGTCSG